MLTRGKAAQIERKSFALRIDDAIDRFHRHPTVGIERILASSQGASAIGGFPSDMRRSPIAADFPHRQYGRGVIYHNGCADQSGFPRRGGRVGFTVAREDPKKVLAVSQDVRIEGD